MSVAENWNHLSDAFLASDAEWLFLVNDDHVYPEDTLLKLLAHDRDVVTGLYLSRDHPFYPVLGETVAADGGIVPRCLGWNGAGLAGGEGGGGGGLLLRRKVLEAIAPPRWELGT